MQLFFLLTPLSSIPELYYIPKTALIGPEAPIVIPKVVQPVEQGLPDFEVRLYTCILKTGCFDDYIWLVGRIDDNHWQDRQGRIRGRCTGLCFGLYCWK